MANINTNNNNILKVGVSELKSVLKEYTKAQVPSMVWGAPGVGKSAIIKELANDLANEQGLTFSEDWSDINKEDKFMLIDLRLSQMSDSSDIKGLYDLDRVKMKTKNYIPDWFPDSGNGIIFLDELNLANLSIQSAAYQLVLDREISGHKLPKGYYVIAAGNRGRIDGARVNDVQVPLLNRWANIEIKESYTEWLEWAENNNINGDIIMFLSNHPEKIWKYEIGSDGREMLSPRVWTMANKFIEVQDSHLRKQVLSGILNKSVVTELEAFIMLRNKYNIKNIIEGKDKLPEDVSEMYSVLSGIIGMFKEDVTLMRKIMEIEFGDRIEFKFALLKFLNSSSKKLNCNDKFQELVLANVGGSMKLVSDLFRKDD